MDDERRPGILLGRVASIPVYLAPSWFAVALVVVLVFAPVVESSVALRAPATYAVAASYAVLLLLSVLVHEFAHALTARALGLPVQRVVADLWGGHTQFVDDAPSAGRSALVAVVGPLANGVLAVLGWALLTSDGVGAAGGGVGRLLVVALVFSNTFVALFNLAPGLPLDGGRVVESGVWAVSGRRWAGTLTAGWCGRVVAVAVVLWGVGLPLLRGASPAVFTLVWSGMIAVLLWQGAGNAIALGRLRRGADRLDLRSHLEAAAGLPLTATAWRPAELAGHPHVVALDPTGHPAGLLRREDAAALVGTQPPPQGTPLSAVVTVLSPAVVLAADATGEDVLQTLARTPARTLVVVDAAGRVVGIADGPLLAGALTGRP